MKTLRQRMRHHTGVLLAVVMSIVITVLLAFLVVKQIRHTPLWMLDDLEHLAYDLRLQAVGVQKSPSSPAIVIIDIDDKSLDQEGRWPWNRQKIARLTEQLQQAGVAVISFDIQFPEHAAKQFLSNIVQAYQRQKKPRNREFERLVNWVDADDKKLAVQLKASQHSKTVIGFSFQHQPRINALSPDTQTVAPTSVRFNGNSSLPIATLSVSGYLSSLPLFQQAATGNGFINAKPDSDGVLRHAVLLIQNQQLLYPSLALETLRIYQQQEKIDVYRLQNNGKQEITHIRVGSSRINTHANGEIIIPYTDAAQRFPSYSATDVLQQKLPAEALTRLKNSIVFVGSSAPRLKDNTVITPFINGFPGLYTQAIITQALLHPETIPAEPYWLSIAVLLLVCLVGLMLSIGLAFFRLPVLVALLVTLPSAFIGFNAYCWLQQPINIPLVIPLLLILSIIMVHSMERILRTYRQKKKMRTMFDQYVPASHINQLLKDPTSFDGDRRYMSVLFADIRHFTQLSEQLTTDEIKQLLNRYFTDVSAVIFKHNGTIDKFVGDMVMAFWNAPIKDQHHARHSIQTALDMLAVTQTFSTGLEQKLDIGIGINTGMMNVGDMGSQHRRAYTVIGDAVNLGSRLESLTKFYHVTLLFSEATKEACEERDAETHRVTSPWVFRYIDYVCVKGKEEAITIYDIVGETNTISDAEQQELAVYHYAIKHFLQREWTQAQQHFQQLHQQQPEVFLYQHYLTRIDDLQRDPPDDWDQVYWFTRK